jgi:phosphoadenosine phosphosulfate reductase
MLHFDSQTNLAEINHRLEQASLDTLLQWSLDTFDDKVAQVTSFGPTGMVILDHLARLSPGIRIITIDTDFLFPETYRLWNEVQRRYPIKLDVRRSALTPPMQTHLHGPRLWAKDPNLCCYLRKVVPLQDVLRGLNAWLTGLRRDQSSTRADIPLVTWDAKYDLVKINPLAGWTRSRVWSYVVEHNLPYNPLHDQGYASIGCTHCTKPTLTSTDERSGRWLGQQKVECGIHLA